MDSIDLIKQTYIQATNDFAVAHGIDKPFTAIDCAAGFPQRDIPTVKTDKITAYQQNAGEHANAWRLLEEIGRKAALVDEMVDALKDCKGGLIYILESYGNLYGVGFERAINKAIIALNKYEALPK